MNTNSDISPAKNWMLPIVLALISLIVSAYSSYNNNDKATAVRVTALETQQFNDHDSLRRIEGKIDHLDEKTDSQFEILRGQINQVGAIASSNAQRREGWTYVPPKQPSK